MFWGSVMSMSDTDRQLIALLRDNARMSVTELAQRLRVSRATVQNRIDKLEQGGVIIGYTVRLKPEAEAHRIRAWMGIAVEGNAVFWFGCRLFSGRVPPD